MDVTIQYICTYIIFTLGSCKRIACHTASAFSLSFLLSLLCPCSLYLFSVALILSSQLCQLPNTGIHHMTPCSPSPSTPPSHSHHIVSESRHLSQRYVSRHQRGQRVVDLPLPFGFFVGGSTCLTLLSRLLSLSLSLCWLIL